MGQRSFLWLCMGASVSRKGLLLKMGLKCSVLLASFIFRRKHIWHLSVEGWDVWLVQEVECILSVKERYSEGAAGLPRVQVKVQTERKTWH